MNDDKNRGAEAFSIGALAVDNSSQPSEKTAAPSTKATSGRIGSVAVKNADQALIEPGEVIETVVHRHPIGIVGIYVEMITGIVVVLIGVALALAGTFGKLPTDAKAWVGMGAFLLIGFLVIILLVSSYVYRASRIIITDQSLVAVVQQAIFSRKISRLSMSNVEDVTAEQRGILPSMLNFGTLTIQTAGQEDNFIFPFCPRPNDVADQILACRQAYARKHDD
ncbi:MAG TPA: PH domain-containing protein [Candidatus Saccharimonadales bacterium]|nr:PH domain-containing protein [Candidatus Saccharimonadales bacterium]